MPGLLSARGRFIYCVATRWPLDVRDAAVPLNVNAYFPRLIIPSPITYDYIFIKRVDDRSGAAAEAPLAGHHSGKYQFPRR